jgi:protein-tyrosine-phosphatase/DNA-binding transcriptional ArsR family regulator
MHAALGEPVRLAMIEKLILTDASPGELGAQFGLGTNLLAHHLKVLQDAGLVRRIRSEGDARRAYLHPRLDDPEVARLLFGGPALTEVLGIAPPARVLFVCTQNSARSQLAAAAWKRVSDLPAASAGTHPAPRVHPRALAVGRRHRLGLKAARTANLADVLAPGDLVVCVCDNAYEELTAAGTEAAPAPVAGRVHWAVPDPVRLDTDAAFEGAYDEITGRVRRLAQGFERAAGRPDPHRGAPQGPVAAG